MKNLLWTSAALLLLSTTLWAQSTGDWVLARWRGGDYWFPGVVESRTGSKVTVAYDDGTREVLYVDKVRPYEWKVGSDIQCRWKGGATWYAARITGMSNADGSQITVLYEDGISENTRTGSCRSR